MKRLGLIVRCDFGAGLSNQSLALWKNMEPDATLVVLMGDKGTGGEDPQRYDPAYIVRYLEAGVQHCATIDEFLSKVDVVLSIETFYEPYLVQRAEATDRELVLYANPELLNVNDPAERSHRYLWPAEWVQDFPAPGEILPWPCSTDVVPRAEINWPPKFVHVGAPAFHDRNGTEIVWDAATKVKETHDLAIYGASLARLRNTDGILGTSVSFCHPPVDHLDLYRDADVLVIPRRYGCLSMTMLEAAAMGVPTLTTDLLPQSDWFKKWGPWLLIPPGEPRMESMKGSRIQWGQSGVGVYEPRPEDLALAMDRLAARADVLDALRVEVREWAEARSWEKLIGQWQTAIRGE